MKESHIQRYKSVSFCTDTALLQKVTREEAHSVNAAAGQAPRGQCRAAYLSRAWDLVM